MPEKVEVIYPRSHLVNGRARIQTQVHLIFNYTILFIEIVKTQTIAPSMGEVLGIYKRDHFCERSHPSNPQISLLHNHFLW